MNIDYLEGKEEAFIIKTIKSKKGYQLVITGSDAHGIAFGIMELCEKIGVSPWNWWADVHNRKNYNLSIPADYYTEQSPSVRYRRFFINDEDFAFIPWCNTTFYKAS